MEGISEILFGLIMVLTLTCSFSVAEANRRPVHDMLLAAVGCNFAWGAIDAVFYLLARFSEQGRGILALQAPRKTTDPSEANAFIAAALPPLLASTLTPTEFDLPMIPGVGPITTLTWAFVVSRGTSSISSLDRIGISAQETAPIILHQN